MKNKFIKMLCLLILGVGLVQCSSHSSNNSTSQNNEQITIIPDPNSPDGIVVENQVEKPQDTFTKIIAKDISASKYKSVVPIVSKDPKFYNRYMGTGTIVGTNTIITNKHVTTEETKDTMYVLLNEGDTTIPFEIENIIEFDEESNGKAGANVDLAIIQVKPNNGRNLSDNIETFKFATVEEINSLKVGDQIEYAGYPSELQPDLFCDKIKVNTLTNSTNYITFQSIAKGGQSGSALLNSENKIVGLLRASNEKEGTGFILNQTTLDFINKNIK